MAWVSLASSFVRGTQSRHNPLLCLELWPLSLFLHQNSDLFPAAMRKSLTMPVASLHTLRWMVSDIRNRAADGADIALGQRNHTICYGLLNVM